MEQTRSSFLEELLEEAQLKEKKLEQAHIDLILLEIRNLNNQIEQTFEQANREREIIKAWALKQNSKLISKVEFLERNLELYMREENLKTLQLAHGEVKLRKKSVSS